MAVDTIKAFAWNSRKNVKAMVAPTKDESASKKEACGTNTRWMSWCVSVHSIGAPRKVGASHQLQELMGGNVEMVAHDDLVHTSNEYGELTNEKVVSA